MMDWSKVAGFGVAGNFTGHLEQAGESPDFVNVQVQDAKAPKGVFPFYLPNTTGRNTSTNPYSHCEIHLLNLHENHQIEPEVSILFDATYEAGLLTSLTPIQAMAHNDCSIRRHGANKISEKKNWGPASKGVSKVAIPLNGLHQGNRLDDYVLGCYLLRDGHLTKYGQTSLVKDYSYYHDTLLNWLIDKFNNQQDTGPLENLSELLKESGYPSQLCISIGATRYTEYGTTTFLKPDDIACVVLYNPNQYSEADIESHLSSTDTALPDAAILKQLVSYCKSN